MKSFEISSYDGTIIRGETTGEGPLLVCVNGLGTSASYWKYLVEYYRNSMTVATYDLRGHGASDLPQDRREITIESHARDLNLLIDRLQGKPAIVAGFSMGVQIVLQHYALDPSQARALILVTGSYRWPISTFYGVKLPPRFVNPLLKWARWTAGLYAPLWNNAFKLPFIHETGLAIGASKATRTDMQPFYDHMAAMHPYWFFGFALAANKHTAENILQTITLPTLVIAGGADRFTPPYLSQAMARKIPTAQLFMLEAGTHTTLLQEPDRLIKRINEFFEHWQVMTRT